MPIPANAPTVLTTTTPLPIICPVCRDSNNCPKHCTNKVFTKSYEMVERELRTRSSVEQPKRAPSLSCRSEDEQWVDISNQRLKGTQMGALYPGSKFKGVQKSGKTSYEVAVKIQVGWIIGAILAIRYVPRQIHGMSSRIWSFSGWEWTWFRPGPPIWIACSGQLEEVQHTILTYLSLFLACWSSWIFFEWISEYQRFDNGIPRTHCKLDTVSSPVLNHLVQKTDQRETHLSNI
jgi:hypothetical protein